MPTPRGHIRVRTGKTYPNPFNTLLGQRNVSMVSRHVPPLYWLWAPAKVFCILEPGYTLVHTVNSIPLFPRCPFIVTFEDYLPRIWPQSRFTSWLADYMRSCLVSPRCARIIAMSNYAIRQFRDQNADFADLKILESKLELLYPSVPLRRREPKQLGKILRVLVVGHDFMHKGIPAVARAHRLLRDKGIRIETHIVSSLRWMPDDNIGPPAADLVEYEKTQLSQDGIYYYGTLSNEKVITLMGQCDFFLFPTFHDTFGYVSIEAMSCGTPVIASNTCAQNEIVAEDESGYLLPIENDRIGKWVWIDTPRDSRYIDAYIRQVDIFADAMAERLEVLCDDNRTYERLSSGAIDRVSRLFDREKARDRLEQIYADAVLPPDEALAHSARGPGAALG